jgi:hypothetical protein
LSTLQYRSRLSEKVAPWLFSTLKQTKITSCPRPGLSASDKMYVKEPSACTESAIELSSWAIYMEKAFLLDA